MKQLADYRLAIRTVVVSTVSAVETHRDAGDDRLVHASVARGLAMLDELASRLPSDAGDEVGGLCLEARRRLSSLQ